MWLPVIGTGRPHKAEVHIKSLARLTCAASGALSGLFPNTRLFFEIQEPEWMIMKLRWDSGRISREHIHLIFPRGTHT
jgi:hypothetical protein